MKKQKKEAGFIVTAELILIATILVIGMIVGLVAIRDAVTAEAGDVAEAIGALDQSYQFEGILDGATNAQIAGAQWNDGVDNGGGDPGDQGFAGDLAGIDFDVDPGVTEDVF